MGNILKILKRLGKLMFFVLAIYNIYWLFFRFSGVIGDYVSLYFYSSIFQGNAALITLSAMFVIYKKQILGNEIYRLEKVIVNYVQRGYGVSFSYNNICELENISEDLIKNLDEKTRKKLVELGGGAGWQARFNELKKVISERDLIWYDAFLPMRGLILVLIGSSILLILTTWLHTNVKIEFLALDIILVFEVINLFNLFNFIKKVA